MYCSQLPFEMPIWQDVMILISNDPLPNIVAEFKQSPFVKQMSNVPQNIFKQGVKVMDKS